MQFIMKLVIALMPIGWGLFTYFMAWGPGGSFIPYGSVNLLVRAIVGLSVTYLFFGSELNKVAKQYQLNFVIINYRFLSWWIFKVLLIMGIGLGVFFIPIGEFPAIGSLALVMASLIYLFFRSNLKNAAKQYGLQFSQCQIPLPPWWVFIILIFMGVGLSFFFVPIWQYPVIESFVLGLLISSCIEEFLTRSFFIKYKMGMVEFIIFNLISSLAFMQMHAFYCREGISIVKLITNGHFQFSFILSTIIYRTQRIELTIILHILSNFIRYTLPCTILHIVPSPLSSELINVLFILVLIGCSYKKIVRSS